MKTKYLAFIAILLSFLILSTGAMAKCTAGKCTCTCDDCKNKTCVCKNCTDGCPFTVCTKGSSVGPTTGSTCTSGTCGSSGTCNGTCDVAITGLKVTPTAGVAPLKVSILGTVTGTPKSIEYQILKNGKMIGSCKTLKSCTSTLPAGTYDVVMKVCCENNCCVNMTQKAAIVVTPAKCVANFAGKITGKKVSFVDTSVGTVTSRKWTFGDGYSSKTKNPVHNYKKAGKYKVCLKECFSGCGCKTICKYVTIK
jgi:PKD domain